MNPNTSMKITRNAAFAESDEKINQKPFSHKLRIDYPIISDFHSESKIFSGFGPPSQIIYFAESINLEENHIKWHMIEESDPWFQDIPATIPEIHQERHNIIHAIEPEKHINDP